MSIEPDGRPICAVSPHRCGHGAIDAIGPIRYLLWMRASVRLGGTGILA
jgi:hypothetical protein